MVSKKLIAWWKDLRKVLLWLPEDYPYLDAIDDLIKHGPKVSKHQLAEWTKYLCMPQGDLAKQSVSALATVFREVGVRVKGLVDE